MRNWTEFYLGGQFHRMPEPPARAITPPYNQARKFLTIVWIVGLVAIATFTYAGFVEMEIQQTEGMLRLNHLRFDLREIDDKMRSIEDEIRRIQEIRMSQEGAK